MASGFIPTDIVYVLSAPAYSHVRYSGITHTLRLHVPRFTAVVTGSSGHTRASASVGLENSDARSLRAASNEPFGGECLTLLHTSENWQWVAVLCAPGLPQATVRIRTEDVLESMRMYGAPVGGVLGGYWQWARHGSVMKLLPVGGPLHTTLSVPRAARTVVKGPLVPGRAYLNQIGQARLYLGQVETTKLALDAVGGLRAQTFTAHGSLALDRPGEALPATVDGLLAAFRRSPVQLLASPPAARCVASPADVPLVAAFEYIRAFARERLSEQHPDKVDAIYGACAGLYIRAKGASSPVYGEDAVAKLAGLLRDKGYVAAFRDLFGNDGE